MKNPLARHGGLTYLHLAAGDVPRTATFYERVCGWKIERRSDDGYRFSDPDGMLIGGFGKPGAPSEPAIVPYVYVDDIVAAVAAAEASGGTIVEPIRPEGDIKVARLRDPSGNVVGVWQFSG
jgi:uncharacterized protein